MILLMQMVPRFLALLSAMIILLASLQTYIKKTENDNYYNGCIADFLGHEIVNNPIVVASRLSADRANSLETPLSLLELDQSIKEAKIRTAGGADGFSNAFLKKFWK